MIESLETYSNYLGPKFTIEYPKGSGHLVGLQECDSRSVSAFDSYFSKDEEGCRPVYGGIEKFQKDPLLERLSFIS